MKVHLVFNCGHERWLRDAGGEEGFLSLRGSAALAKCPTCQPTPVFDDVVTRVRDWSVERDRGRR